MLSYFLKFNRREALQYQRTILDNLILEATDELDTLEKKFDSEMSMRRAVNEAALTWQSMTKIMKPLATQEAGEKKVGFQEKVVKFLKRKRHAICLMLEGNQDPQVIKVN